MDGLMSHIIHLSAGVPQGCALSPLLFIIYINDIGKIGQDIATRLFADDAVIWPTTEGTLDDKISVLQQGLNEIQLYCREWKITINVKKTQVVHFRNIRSSKTVSPKQIIIRKVFKI